VTLKPGLGVTQGHRKLYHSIRHSWLPINNTGAWRTATQPASHPPSQTRCRSKYRAYCVAQVKTMELSNRTILQFVCF